MIVLQFPLLRCEAAAFVWLGRVALWTGKGVGGGWLCGWRMFQAPERDAALITDAVARVRGATCLTRAMAAQEMLRRRGMESEIRVGVALEGGFRAHAWLVRDGETLMGGAGAAEYAELLTIPAMAAKS